MQIQTQEETVKEIKELRVYVDGITQLVQGLDLNKENPTAEVDPKNPKRSREISITITKLQEGKMWLGKLLQAIGAENPYPESMNSNNETIEPAADIAEKNKGIPIYVIAVGETLTHIKKVKQLRKMIEEVISRNIFSDIYLHKIDRMILKKNQTLIMLAIFNSCTKLNEAKMWLMVELGRVKKEN